jgi:amino acid transporter
MTAHEARSQRTLRRIFAAPLILAAITGVGLVAALTGDGIWDMLSWIALGIPLATLIVFVSRPSRRSRPERNRQ